MAISFIAEAHAIGAAGSCVINVPAGVANGDVLLVGISWSDLATSHASWVDIIKTQPRTGEDFYWAYRVAASEPASYTFAGGAGTAEGVILAYRGVNTSSPIDVAAAAGTAVTSGTTITAPTVTTATDGAMLICGFASRAAGNFSQPTGMTERFDGTTAAFESMAADEQIIASHGATGTRASTYTLTISFARAVSFALQPIPTETGTIASTLPKVTASFTGTQTYTGTIASTLVKVTAAFVGNQASAYGTIASTLVKVTAAFVSQQTQTGTIASTLVKVTAAFGVQVIRRGFATVTSVRLDLARVRDRANGSSESSDRRGGRARNRDE